MLGTFALVVRTLSVCVLSMFCLCAVYGYIIVYVLSTSCLCLVYVRAFVSV